MKSLSFKKVPDGYSDKHITINVFIFLKIVIQSQKSLSETQ